MRWAIFCHTLILRIRPGNRIAKESTLSGNLHLQSSTTKQNICCIRAQKIISLSSLFVLDNFSRTEPEEGEEGTQGSTISTIVFFKSLHTLHFLLGNFCYCTDTKLYIFYENSEILLILCVGKCTKLLQKSLLSPEN